MTNPPCPAARGIQRVKKALQRLPPLGGEKMKSFFSGGVYPKRDLSRIFSMKLRSCKTEQLTRGQGWGIV